MRDDVDIQGETTHSLSFDCLKFYDRGRYRCRVTIECDLLTEPLSGTSNPVDVRLSGMLELPYLYIRESLLYVAIIKQ